MRTPNRRASRGRSVVRFGWLSLVLFALIALGATQAGSRPPRCVSDRDCRHLRNASCGDAGLCVEHTKPAPKTSRPSKFSCANTSCGNGTFCIEKSGKAACVDPCEPNPCLNGARCVGQDAQTHMCSCAPGWTGDDCSENINECLLDPCDHGTCTDFVDGYTCSCANGWTGTDCDVDIDECLNHPCQHGGTCTNLVAGYSCACTDGWTGTYCQVNVP